MKKLFIFLIILKFSFLMGAHAKIDKYKKGDLVNDKIKLNNKKSVNLPKGEWEVYYR